MDAIVSKVKGVLLQAEEVPEGEVTPERAEGMNGLLGEAISADWRTGSAALLVRSNPVSYQDANTPASIFPRGTFP